MPNYLNEAPTKHAKLLEWVDGWVKVMKPANVYWCDGSQEEYDKMAQALVDAGLATVLNEEKRPKSLLFRSDPTDVARVENRTYIATKTQEGAGPTNNWIDPVGLKETMMEKYDGCMAGRTMYVIPFSMGPVGSDIAKIGMELTDSPYVVINMDIMARVGTAVLEVLGEDGEFIPTVHTVGKPLAEGEADNGVWPCAPIEDKYISHFPETREIWSYGSGYGGNALLGKKCLALRIASAQARDEGWMAEHMLILKLTNPAGESKVVTGAFPSACGKTNLAMLMPTLEGWKVETIGDDIAWMKFKEDGRLYAINPEAGFFGVAPGTSDHSNEMAMRSIDKETIFTNVGLTEDGDVWWEEIGYDAPSKLIDWKGNEWEQATAEAPAAHPNARFTAKMENCPSAAPEWQDPAGVPVDAFLFGGRRPSTIPLIHQARDWNHGVFMGSVIGSEVTAAAIGLKAGVRRDPMAMLPFCGYNMGEYFAHWVNMGTKTDAEKLPKIFYVNWFRKTAEGKWLWPGFGENSRVLKWVFERCAGTVEAVETAIGFMPKAEDIDTSGLDVTADDMAELLSIDKQGWLDEIEGIKEHYAKFNNIPAELAAELKKLEENIAAL